MKSLSRDGRGLVVQLILFAVLVFVSCSKDADLLRAAVTEDGTPPIIEQDSTDTGDSEGVAEGDSDDDTDPSGDTNTPPTAIISANTLTGTAPTQIEFNGNDSQDDKGIEEYQWEFGDGTVFDSITTYEFQDPGIYDVSLTVFDVEGLQSTATLTVTISASQTGKIACETGGGKANDTGSKIWCWANIDFPDYSGSTGVGFSNGELFIDSECDEKQVGSHGNELKFYIDPLAVPDGNWCSREYNMRAELRTAPWDIRHSLGTEEWFGWNYRFGSDYKIDLKNQWKFFQVHPGVMGLSPQIGLEVIHDSQFNGHSAGEVYITNATISENYSPTGIVPKAGETLKIVVHVVWGDSSNGLLQVWINDQKVYDRQVSTVYADYLWGGNAKWGIYKWPWASENGVQNSIEQGISNLETYMGTLRMITRRQDDPDYLKEAYSIVVPD